MSEATEKDKGYNSPISTVTKYIEEVVRVMWFQPGLCALYHGLSRIGLSKCCVHASNPVGCSLSGRHVGEL
jgi:hypothetical protein